MANAEHVEVVRQGAAVIAEWRLAHPEEGLDLRRADLNRTDLSTAILYAADLRDADLRYAIFHRSVLSEADLRGANLSKANLNFAVLSDADLRNTNLRGSDLGYTILLGSDLSRADLNDANVSGAILNGTNLNSANLSEADLSEASFGWTVLADTDLTGVTGLLTVRHSGPSTVDHRTLERSGMLPDEFLRGCGLPDDLIEYFRDTYDAGPIQFYSAFISYSSANQDFADRLHADLQSNGVRCWLATEDLKTGDRFRDTIDRAIRVHDKLLLVLSEESIASAWVESEVEGAFEKERRNDSADSRTVLFPIRLDGAVMETDEAWAANIRRTRHIGDFTDWKDHDSYQRTFERLLRDLKAGTSQPD